MQTLDCGVFWWNSLHAECDGIRAIISEATSLCVTDRLTHRTVLV